MKTLVFPNQHGPFGDIFLKREHKKSDKLSGGPAVTLTTIGPPVLAGEPASFA